jgi:hypothetical protein
MNETNSWCSEKKNKIDKTLYYPRKKEKIQINKIRDEKEI